VGNTETTTNKISATQKNSLGDVRDVIAEDDEEDIDKNLIDRDKAGVILNLPTISSSFPPAKGTECLKTGVS
jgi:hypothetical protein